MDKSHPESQLPSLNDHFKSLNIEYYYPYTAYVVQYAIKLPLK